MNFKQFKQKLASENSGKKEIKFALVTKSSSDEVVTKEIDPVISSIPVLKNDCSNSKKSQAFVIDFSKEIKAPLVVANSVVTSENNNAPIKMSDAPIKPPEVSAPINTPIKIESTPQSSASILTKMEVTRNCCLECFGEEIFSKVYRDLRDLSDSNPQGIFFWNGVIYF